MYIHDFGLWIRKSKVYKKAGNVLYNNTWIPPEEFSGLEKGTTVKIIFNGVPICTLREGKKGQIIADRLPYLTNIEFNVALEAIHHDEKTRVQRLGEELELTISALEKIKYVLKCLESNIK